MVSTWIGTLRAVIAPHKRVAMFEAHRYLNMNDLKEHKKIHLRQAA
jgi:hypothetical protein